MVAGWELVGKLTCADVASGGGGDIIIHVCVIVERGRGRCCGNFNFNSFMQNFCTIVRISQ